MPEIAAISFVGMVFTFIAVNFNLYWVHRSFQKPQFKILNRNLSKVSRYWSIEQSRMVEMNSSAELEADLQRDYQKATRSAFLFGTMMIFLSWLGLILCSLYFISTNKWAKSRLEERLFSSILVEDENLHSDQVSKILAEIESLSI